jgi:hypothetical protein
MRGQSPKVQNPVTVGLVAPTRITVPMVIVFREHADRATVSAGKASHLTSSMIMALANLQHGPGADDGFLGH